MGGRDNHALAGLALALAFLAAPTGAAAQEPLLPDLTPAPLVAGETVGLYRDGVRDVLDVGFRVANLGAGPLELAPLPEPPAGDPAADCDGDGDPDNDRPERQSVYLDQDADGVFDPDVDTNSESRGDGCSIFHPAHNHWHAAVMSADLYRQSTGDNSGGIDKLTFCLGDIGVFDSGLPGFDPAPGYDPGACSTSAPQGISIGWYDRYVIGLAGQQIDVTGMPAGRYCVRQSVDSAGSIDELDETNNVTETRLRIDPATAELQVLAEPCAVEPDPPVVDATPPDTVLLRAPPARVRTAHRKARVQFGFIAAEPGALLACSVDGAAFAPCDSPFQARLRARRGLWIEHDFAVRAIDAAGNADPSPAQWSGRVRRHR